MTLKPIVDSIGGEYWDGGRKALVPRPNGPRHDRSVSLRLVYDSPSADPRLVVNCLGSGSWQDVLDDYRGRGFIDAKNRLRSGGGGAISYNSTAPEPTDLERLNAAKRIWDAGRSISKTPTERYAAFRKIRRPLPGIDTLRHSSAVPLRVYDQDSSPTRNGCLVAMTTAEGDFCALEVTYLEPNGRKAQGLRIPRKTVATVPRGAAVRIDAADADMLVGEGYWTTLSASERFSLPAWALMSTSRMRFWSPPPGVRRLLIAADNGPAGQQAAEQLAERARTLGIRPYLEFPLSQNPALDWNDLASELDEPPIVQTPPWAA